MWGWIEFVTALLYKMFVWRNILLHQNSQSLWSFNVPVLSTLKFIFLRKLQEVITKGRHLFFTLVYIFLKSNDCLIVACLDAELGTCVTICVNTSLRHWRKGKKPTSDAVSGIFIYDSLSGDTTKICWEFPTFTVDGLPSRLRILHA